MTSNKKFRTFVHLKKKDLPCSLLSSNITYKSYTRLKFFSTPSPPPPFRLKPQMKVSFVWMWPYRILDARAQKECSWRAVHVLLQISWLAGALRVIIAALATSRASTQLQPSSSSWQHFLFASCVVCWWHEVWAPFHCQGRRTTLLLRSLGRENCFVVTRRCFLRTKSEKLFPSRPSFLRRRTSTGFASRRFSRWQSENQKDSRLGRERIIISWRDLCATECRTDKNGESWACVRAMCSMTGQGLHVCMRAYLRNLLGSAARCWPNPCCSAFVRCL